MNEEENRKNIIDFYTTVGVKGMDEMTEIDHRLDWEIPLLEQVFPDKTKTLLDVGSGQGRIALRLAEKGYGIIGIDLIRDFVDYTNEVGREKKLNCRFICDDFFNLDKYDVKVDGAYCMWGTIRHILDENAQINLLKKIYAVLENNCEFLIDTIDEDRLENAPNIDNEFQYREIITEGEHVYAKVNHKKLGKYTVAYCFNEKKLRHIFEASGFTQIRRVYVEKDASRLVIVGKKA